MYLEWYRVQRMSPRDSSDEEKRWWEHQRTYGLCQAVRLASEQNELGVTTRFVCSIEVTGDCCSMLYD